MVCANPDIDLVTMEKIMANKTITIPENIETIDLKNFIYKVKNMGTYKIEVDKILNN